MTLRQLITGSRKFGGMVLASLGMIAVAVFEEQSILLGIK
jgi:hypothetical protein